MAGISFLSDNLVDDAVLSVTTGAANAQFPISNLLLDFTTKKFRSQGNTVVFVVDWLQFRDVDFVSITGDATTSLGITACSVKLSITTDFTMSTSYSLDLNAKYNIGFKAIPTISARYAEVTLTGTGSYSEIGKIFIGEKLNLPFNSIAISTFKMDRDDNSSVRSNEFGQKFIDIRNSVVGISGSIRNMNKEETDIIDDLFMRHGKNKPLWLVLDESGMAMIDGEYKLTAFVYLTSNPSFSAAGGSNYNVSLKMDLVV